MSQRFDRGALEVVGAMNRRRFLRGTANSLFSGVAVLAAGGGLSAFMASPAEAAPATGQGCPVGCGESPCCSYSGRSTACHCATGTTCKSGTANCKGMDSSCYTQSGGCWTYRSACATCGVNCCCITTTTCCDCKTSGCGDPAPCGTSHCIGWTSSRQMFCAGKPPKMVAFAAA